MEATFYIAKLYVNKIIRTKKVARLPGNPSAFSIVIYFVCNTVKKVASISYRHDVYWPLGTYFCIALYEISAYLLIEDPFGVVRQIVLLISNHQQYGEGKEEGRGRQECHAPSKAHRTHVSSPHFHLFNTFFLLLF